MYLRVERLNLKWKTVHNSYFDILGKPKRTSTCDSNRRCPVLCPSAVESSTKARCFMYIVYREFLWEEVYDLIEVWCEKDAEPTVFFFGLRTRASVQFSSVAQSCPTLCDPMNRSTPGLPVHHQLPEFTQTHVHRVCDAIKPIHPWSSPSPSPNPSQHQSLFQWVSSSHQVAKVLELQL